MVITRPAMASLRLMLRCNKLRRRTPCRQAATARRRDVIQNTPVNGSRQRTSPLPPIALSDPPDDIAEAARLLRQGELVGFPTETVYGLGGDATNGRAVAAIFAAKGRPSFNPLIVHVPDAAQAGEHAEMTPL